MLLQCFVAHQSGTNNCTIMKIQLPTNMLISGSTNCRKIFLLAQLLLNREKNFEGKIKNVIFCAAYETSVPQVSRAQPWLIFNKGCPSQSLLESFNENSHTIVVLDDLLEQRFQDKFVSQLFSQVLYEIWTLNQN